MPATGCGRSWRSAMLEGDGDTDRLLAETGARWRESQPEPRRVTSALFADDRGSRFELGWGARTWSFVAGAASAVVLLVVVAVTAPGVLPRIGSGGPGATTDT